MTQNFDLDSLKEQARLAIHAAADLAQLQTVRTYYLGKQGVLTQHLKGLAQLPPQERSDFGKTINLLKQFILESFASQESVLAERCLETQLQREMLDVTLPGRASVLIGQAHPVHRIRARIERLLGAVGFSLVEGPEIEDDYHNFSALNFPQNHPARAMHDTFYFDNGLLLRTHTSCVQVRVMQNQRPPLRVIAPGRVYRCDSDHTHTPMFHQLEGLVVDEQCTFADLKGLLQDFFNRLFERELKFRFRASYFPFTEPSAEADIGCFKCEARGCRVCGNTGWLEVLGAGMVHPNVLTMCGIDNERYTGFAFGMGLDRLAMLRYGIDDLRKLFENDVRFLRQR